MKRPDKPTMKRAVLAFCHECLGYYQDGIVDCENTRCPLYQWMPRRKLEPDTTWLNYNPRRQGRVRWEDCAEMSDEQKKVAGERLRAMREKKG